MNTSGVDDADDWYNRWQNRHHSDLFPGNFARLALAALESADDGLARNSCDTRRATVSSR